MNKVLYIVNPAGHGGGGIKAFQAFKSAWGESIDPAQVMITERAGHAEQIAAAADGYDIIVAVGGDGTVGEVISGIMKRTGIRPKLAIIPCGTGNDIARVAGIHSVVNAATALRAGKARAFDLIRVDGQIGEQADFRYAFLFGNTGFSGIPMLKPWMKRLLGATGAYYLATLKQIFFYRAPKMTVRVDDQEFTGHTYLVVAGNAEWVSGGSMRLSPGAIPDDGLLNVSIIPSLSVFTVVTKLFFTIAKGTHINTPGVSYITGRKIEVHSEPPAVVDLDGELFGTTPVTYTVCPGILEMVYS
ncbi:MAG: diacylglycerol kinase family protein [Pontiella sp.]